MKPVKKIISFFMAAALVASSLPAIAFSAAALPTSTNADASLVLNRPMASTIATDVTRVAYAVNSFVQPSGTNSVIVRATPSGVPYNTGVYASLAYAGETPAYSQVSFTPGVELESAPTISCSNTTVTMSNYTYSNGTYVWLVTGGTATVGTSLIFTVTYNFSETNSVTGKVYTHTFRSYAVSSVQAIASVAGVNTTKRTYENWVLGTTTKNRSYLASYVLGINTVGSYYDSGSGDGSINFNSSTLGWTADYGNMKNFSDSNASRQYNVSYNTDGNRPLTYVYMDKSIHSTLSDLNLRLQTVLSDEAASSDEQVTVSVENMFFSPGITTTFSDSSTTNDPSTDETASLQLGLNKFSGSVKGIGKNILMYFTGVGPAESNTTTDYTVSVKYKTAASWDNVYVGHSFSLEVLTYNKGALRTLVEDIQNSDPMVMTSELPDGEFKGYNPQSWYYSLGWEGFLNAFNAAKSCLVKPNVTQTFIDEKYQELVDAYSSLVLDGADYSLATAYYNQALTKQKSNYTLASWAKLETALNSYATGYSVLYQPAVDKMAKDIKFAIDNLVEADANYSEVLKQLIEVNRIMSNSKVLYGVEASVAYSNWYGLTTALANAGCVYNTTDGYVVDTILPISEQAKVDGYVILIKNAIEKLTLSGANYTAANQAETAYKQLNLSYIDEDYLTSLTPAYNAVVALHGLDISHQGEIDAAVVTLKYYLDNIEYKPADLTAARALINTANALDRSIYTDMTAVDNAVATLRSKFDLDIRYQLEVNRAVTALQSAINNLTKKTADYSQVDSAIEAAEALSNEVFDTYGLTVQQFYTNWSAVETAINSVVRNRPITEQSAVNSYATAINNAVAALTETSADYTQVTAILASAHQIATEGENLYTTDSLDNLTDACMSVVTGKKISEQATVDGYVTTIQSAIDALEYLDANYTLVNSQQTIAQARLKTNTDYKAAHPGYSYYTDDSVAALEQALANVVTGLDIRSQAQVDGYATAISTAITNLKLSGADYTLVDQALLRVPTDTSVYTTLSVATLNATINSINRTYKSDKQATVDRYVTAINNAIDALEYKTADYSAVTAALAKVPDDASIYTQSSWDNLTQKVNAVVYNLDITHQSEVNAFAADIENAVLLLQKNAANYDAVTQAIASVPTDLSIYTDTTVNALNDALAAVVLGLDITHQSDVDKMAQDIEEAVTGLLIKDGSYANVSAAVESANDKISTDNYTDETVAALQAVIDSIVYNLDITHQEEIDGFAESVINATNALQYKDASYDAFNVQIERLATLEDFSAEDYNTIKAVADAVDKNANITYQQTIDDATAQIKSMLDAVPADYSALDSAISDANAKIETGNYTETSVSALNEKIQEVVRNLNFEHQSEIDNYKDNIVKATNDLALKLADYTELENILDLLDNSGSKIYTITYSNFDDVMSAIVAYRNSTVTPNMNLTIDKQTQVDEMAATLQGYIDSLVIKVSFEAKEGSTTVISGNYIYGLKTRMTKSAFLNNYVSVCNATVTCESTARYLGTGTVVTVTSDITGEVIGTYTIIIFGDIDSDGNISSNDTDILKDYNSGAVDITAVQKKAANLNGDRYVTSLDTNILADAVSGSVVINQATARVAE